MVIECCDASAVMRVSQTSSGCSDGVFLELPSVIPDRATEERRSVPMVGADDGLVP
jgi:hypothetical protein